MSTQSMGDEGFKWFLGIIEDTLDPLKLGRVRVRVFNEHDDNVDTDKLPWAQVLVPTTSASLGGVGVSPTGMLFGTKVVGFFIDGHEKQFPMVLGSFHTIPGMKDDNHGVNTLARGQQTLLKQQVGPEPKSAYVAEYPYNHVTYTNSGHAIELDDTPDNERIHIYHKSGTYIEVNHEGTIVAKSVKDDIEVIVNDKTIYVQKGNTLIEADAGNITIVANKGDVNITAKTGKINVNAKSDVNVVSNKMITVLAPRVNINA